MHFVTYAIIASRVIVPFACTQEEALGDDCDASERVPTFHSSSPAIRSDNSLVFGMTFLQYLAEQELGFSSGRLALPPPPPAAVTVATVTGQERSGQKGVRSLVKGAPSIGCFVGRRSKEYGSCAVVIFTLIPSGRALTLTVSQDAVVLDAKGEITFNEGVPTYQQRLLWRGASLEPDHASICELGIRSGDTPVVGYRVPRRPCEVMVANFEPSAIEESTEVASQKVAELCGASNDIVNNSHGEVVRKNNSAEATTENIDKIRAAKRGGWTGVNGPADVRGRNGGVAFVGGNHRSGSGARIALINSPVQG